MNYYESKMEIALAEILGVSSDTIEILNLTIENNIGNDDCFYGYYVEFPKKSDIDTSTLSTLEQSDIEKIPWGETEYYTEGDFANTSVDPFGYKAEWEYEKYFQEHSPSKENILIKLKEIKNTIIHNEISELTIKSLIFCAFSITESYMKSLVWEVIPESEKDDDPKHKNIIKKLDNTKERISLFKQYSENKLKYIPYFQTIRYSLAHDMISPTIANNIIEIKDKDDNICNYDFINVMDELIDYINNPIEVQNE